MQNMDAENAPEMELRQSRKRKGEKCSADDANIDNHRKTKKTFQENIVQKKQTRNRKTKFNVQENSLKVEIKVEKDSDDSTADKADVPKEESDENAKTPKKPSKRQLKKEMALQREAQKRHTRKVGAMQRALTYVSKWKHSRSEWKFEKIRQIWLIDNLLDENSISDAMFPVVLEYFEGCKGMAREVLLRKGMDVIRKAEEEEDDDSRNKIMESVAYKRARQLLQALPTDR